MNADANTINKIQTPTQQWISVTNLEPCRVGRDVESDSELRERRIISSSIPSMSIRDGIQAALQNIAGVRFVNVVDNPTGSPVNGIDPHSIYCVVDADEDRNEEIARTILLKKAPGIGTCGDVAVNIPDSSGNVNVIRFKAPETRNVPITISVKRLSGWDEAAETRIKSAVTAYMDDLHIGEPLVVSALYGAAFTANEGSTLTFAITGIHAEIPSGMTTGTVDAGIAEMLRAGTISVTYTE